MSMLVVFSFLKTVYLFDCQQIADAGNEQECTVAAISPPASTFPAKDRGRGAGGGACWRRWGHAGAGDGACWRRWGKEGKTCATGERMDTICGAGPPPKMPPAPKPRPSCTKTGCHLRQDPVSPAPNSGATCIKTGRHLRQKTKGPKNRRPTRV